MMAFIFFCSLFRPFICPGRPSSHRSFGAGITARLLVEWNITISDKRFFTMSRMGEPLQSFRYRPSVHGDFFIFICIFFIDISPFCWALSLTRCYFVSSILSWFTSTRFLNRLLIQYVRWRRSWRLCVRYYTYVHVLCVWQSDAV